MNEKKRKVCVIGLGYVGLPLALAFGENIYTIGYDISKKRVLELKKNFDINLEHSKREFKKSTFVNFTSNYRDIKECNYYIITVPTPIFTNKSLDLRHVVQATRLVSKILNTGDTIIYESTVYPGFTEEICIPILNDSNLKLNKGYYVGYSPERINPGDKKHSLKKIIKVTSGSCKRASKDIDELYSIILLGKTYKAPSIKIAEAAKAIENAQRDVNIAFMNELTKIFNLAKIDMGEVLKASRTKWNFIDFKPGFVGGHCIGVDPYYLNYLARKNNYTTKIILNGRNVNNSMSSYILKKTLRIAKENYLAFSKTKVLLLGYTFKENCPDFRNTMSKDIFLKLRRKFKRVEIYDPYVSIKDVENKTINIVNNYKITDYNIVIILVKHSQFKKIKFNKSILKKVILYDFHNFLNLNEGYKY